MPAKAPSKKSSKRTVKKIVKPQPEVSVQPETQAPQPPPVEAAPSPHVVEPPHPPVAAPVAVTSTAQDLEQFLASEPEDEKANRANTVLLVFGALFAGIIIVASIAVFIIYTHSSTIFVPTLSNKPVPTLSPTPTVSKSSITFEVFNATGVSGLAAKDAQELTSAGYTVLTVGSKKRQTATQLFVAGSVPAASLNELLADTSSLFSIASVTGVLTDSTASARLILGAK